MGPGRVVSHPERSCYDIDPSDMRKVASEEGSRYQGVLAKLDHAGKAQVDVVVSSCSYHCHIVRKGRFEIS